MNIKPKENCRWDLLSLGEVMLRFDPGDRRIWTTDSFEVCEGGGEYNVARGLKRCFGLDAAIVTAFADNPVGRLLQDFIYQGGVDQSLIRWVELRWRRPLGAQWTQFHRARLWRSRRPGKFRSRPHRRFPIKARRYRLGEIFGKQGARWFHTGGIFCALSATTPEVAHRSDAVAARTRHHCFLRSELPRISLEIPRRQEISRKK